MSSNDERVISAGRVKGRAFALYSLISSQAFGLLRNIVVARLLAPEEFGVAAMIILTIAFLDSFSNAGPQNLLLQAKDKDRGPLLAAAHAVTLGRGISTAVLLLLIAEPIAHIFALEFSPLAIYLVAASSLVSGFRHFGPRLAQREGDFRRESMVTVVGDFVALAVSIPAAVLTRSHLAIVIGLVARSVVIVVLSHLLAPQRYQLSWDRQHIGRYWSFGWPLLINGPFLFFAGQADRLFISRELGVTTLGIYSAALVLMMSPSSAVQRWITTIYMPSLAKYYHAQGGLRERGVVFNFTAAMLALALVMFVGFAVLGAPAVKLLYGHKFTISPFLVSLIGYLQTVRFLRAWPSTLALSAAASGRILLTTIVRMVALATGYAGVVFVGGLEGLVAGFIVGELVALAFYLLLVNERIGRPATTGMSSLAVLVLVGVVVMSVCCVWPTNWFALGLTAFISLGLGVLMLAVSISLNETRRLIARLLRRIAPEFHS